MDHRLALLCLSLAALSPTVVGKPASASGSSWNDNRYRDYDSYGGRYDDVPRARDAVMAPSTHTYQSSMQCAELCQNPCTATTVYLQGDEIPMYSCDKLKPPRQASPFFQTLKGNSFYLSLAVIGVIVVSILVLITMCFCCSYCCRNPSSAESSRGSSKQALAHNEDGEFKEYLNGTGSANGNGLNGLASNGHHHHHLEDNGAMKRERDFTRRPRPMVV